MRKTWLVGGLLVVAAMIVVVLSDLLDLELEAVTVLGLISGAVVALVPDRSAAGRMIGFIVGFVAAWVGYLVRAGVLPDSLGGRLVAVTLVLGLCVVVAGVTANRVPLWATLLGAGAMVGAFEHLYAAAPPEVVGNSLSAATALLMTSGIGFLVVALGAPTATAPGQGLRRAAPDGDNTHSLNDLMEKSK